jgi:hypothetical protein
LTRQSDLRVVAEIKKRFGSKIDLDKSPFVILEIIRNFRNYGDGGGGSGGGPDGGGGSGGGPTVSSIAGGMKPALERLTNEDLMREILKLRKSLSDIQKSVK